MIDKKKLAKTVATHGLAALGGAAIGETMARNTDPLFSLLVFFYKVIDMGLKGQLLIKPQWSSIFNKLLSSDPNRDLVGFWMLELAERTISGEKLDDILEQQVKWSQSELREHVSKFVVDHFGVADEAIADSIASTFPDVKAERERQAHEHRQRLEFAAENLPEIIDGLKDEKARNALRTRLQGKQRERVFEFLVGMCGVKGRDPEEVLTTCGLLSDDEFYQGVDFVLR